jgi:3-deoxy-D-arabino-heptulosonate 7-phosphate (DAHP) synthase
VLPIPLLQRRGGRDLKKNIAEGILALGADGVVRNVFDHPVCASKVASQHFLIAQPPLLWRREWQQFYDFGVRATRRRAAFNSQSKK